jgi:hypothetical protein
MTVTLSALQIALEKWNGSVNFYMFQGGTNFGFMNGANLKNEFPFYFPAATTYGEHPSFLATVTTTPAPHTILHAHFQLNSPYDLSMIPPHQTMTPR